MTHDADIAARAARAQRMPVIFVGHGSPMNAIEHNRFSEGWDEMGRRLRALPEAPRAIVAVSAHWMTAALSANPAARNRQINDMYGFPEELYEVHYEPAGDPELAQRIVEASGGTVNADASWGCDHGAWVPLSHLFPAADVPVVMASVAPGKRPAGHFAFGRLLRSLRDEGVLILASGNVVHSFAYADMADRGLASWARAFDDQVRDKVLSHVWDDLLDYRALGRDMKRAFQTPEHYLPLPVALGAAYEDEPVFAWNEGGEMGAFSMTSYAFGLGGASPATS